MNRVPLFLAGVLALGVAACGGPKDVSFPAGTTMDRLHRAGRITVGIKYDQPGVGFKSPATGKFEGFDIKMAEIIAAELGLESRQIVYRETVSQDRERSLANGDVDIVIASYSIEDHRREVGQAGPYFVTGQQLLVREADKRRINDPYRLSGVRICSVTGSTSIAWVQERYQPEFIDEFRTYTECVRQLLRRRVDAVTTDGAILLGYAAQQPDKLEVVGKPFSRERYGIGYRKGDRAFCQFLTDTIAKAMRNGEWETAFRETLGKAGVATPAKPTLDPCRD